MKASGPGLLVVAGEASGDLHAGRLLAALRARLPGLRAFGVGGERLVSAGLERLADSSEIAVVGIVEALKVVPRARAIFRMLLAEVDARGTRFALLVDAPELNLRVARALKRRGVTVIYYISPQVWAWRKRRLHAIQRDVDRMLVLFPFEETFYRAHGQEAVHVGHPLVDEVPELAHVWDDTPSSGPPSPVILSLLPGSRRSEVSALLPTLLAAVERLAAEREVSVRLIRAATIPEAVIAPALASCAVPVEVMTGEARFAAIAGSHLALCASGTATLEVGLLGTPMIVVYRLAVWSYLLGRLLVKLPAFSLVNLVLDRQAVPELLQRQTRPRQLAAEAAGLFADRARVDRMRADLAALRPRLGVGGASERAAAEAAAVIEAAS